MSIDESFFKGETPLACEAKDLIECMRSSKDSTFIQTDPWNKLLTDNMLPHKAAALWQILFTRAVVHEDLQVEISYNQLAEIMNISVRTVQRHIKILKGWGYLLIEKNYSPNRSQEANTFLVRFPKAFVKQTRKTKANTE